MRSATGRTLRAPLPASGGAGAGARAAGGASTSAVGLFIDPPDYHFLEDRLFDSDSVPFVGEDLMAPYRRLRERFAASGVPVHTVDRLDTDRCERNLVLSFGGTRAYRRLEGRGDVVLSAFFAMECPIVEPRLYRALPGVARSFRRVYSWSDGDALLPFTRRRTETLSFRWPQSLDRVRDDLWARTDRKFLVMINANKLPRLYDRELYTERLRAVEYFHRFGEIDLYGKNWGRMPNRVGRTRVPYTARRVQRRLWEWRQQHWPDPIYAAATAANRGTTPSKLATLAAYRFAICFENMTLRGWITEKLFDCLFAGTVPVYLGAPDITDWVPADCFIDTRRFRDFAALRAHLHDLPASEVQRYREAGRDFVASARFDPFRIAAFIDRIAGIARDDAGIDV